jgi:hypothetical protein
MPDIAALLRGQFDAARALELLLFQNPGQRADRRAESGFEPSRKTGRL